MTLSTEQQRGAATANGAVAAAEEYAASELPASERHSTLSITLVRMGYTVSATDLRARLSPSRFIKTSIMSPGGAALRPEA